MNKMNQVCVTAIVYLFSAGLWVSNIEIISGLFGWLAAGIIFGCIGFRKGWGILTDLAIAGLGVATILILGPLRIESDPEVVASKK
jgi:hypothetical protein